MEPLSQFPNPPYYAVIFTSRHRYESDADAYAAMAERMVELARNQPGFLGIESVRGADGVGVTISYWQDEESIRRWHEDAEHREAQRLGYAQWYEGFRLRVCRVERHYGFDN